MIVRLTPLGVAAGGVPRPGGAGSGHLVQEGTTSILLDCGNGVLGNLVRCLPAQRVDAVVITHLHPDHFSDLYPFLLHRTRFTNLRVLAPPGARRKIDAWLDAMSGNPALYRNALDLVEFAPGKEIRIGGLRVIPMAVEHGVPAFGLRVEVGGLRRKAIVYSGDSRRCDALVELARDADLFLCEATLQDGVGDAEFNRRQLEAHMTARQAGEVATKAGARSLVLTHLMYYLDPAQSQAQAQSTSLCPVSVAREHQAYDLS